MGLVGSCRRIRGSRPIISLTVRGLGPAKLGGRPEGIGEMRRPSSMQRQGPCLGFSKALGRYTGMGSLTKQWVSRKCDRCATIRPHFGRILKGPSTGLGYEGSYANDYPEEPFKKTKA